MAKKKELVARSLSMNEYDEFQDFIEKPENSKMSPNKQMRKFAIWIGENIYGLDAKDNSVSPATYMKLLSDTMELTNKANEEEIKNLETSGNGVSVAE